MEINQKFFTDVEKVTRRDFLKLLLATSAGVGATACGISQLLNNSEPEVTTPTSIPPNEIPPTPDLSPRYLSESEVLAIPIGKSASTGELIPLRSFFEDEFKTKPEILGLFVGADDISFSAMGIEVHDQTAPGGRRVYPIFSVVSESQKKARLAPFVIPEPGNFRAPLLNRVVNPYGKVDLAITNDIITGKPLAYEQYIYVFSTQLTTEEINAMTPEELASINLYFYLGKANVPYRELFTGAAKVEAMVAPITPEAPSLPENLGDSRYVQEIEKHQWEYRDGKTEIWVDFGWGKGLELAFKQNAQSEYELEKFYAPAPEGWDKVTAQDIKGNGPDGSCFLFRPARGDYYVQTRLTGRLYIERRRDLITGEKLPGHMVVAEAVSRKETGTPDFYFDFVLFADNGDGINMMIKQTPMKNIFDYAINLPPGYPIAVLVPIEKSSTDWEVYSWLEPNIESYKSFIADPYSKRYLIIPNGTGVWH